MRWLEKLCIRSGLHRRDGVYKYFFGSFNKAHNHRDSDYLKKECDLDYYFDEKIYNEIADNIRMVLGNCKTYSVQDVFHYFQSQYAAYPIDIRYYYNYVNTSVIKCDAFSRFTISKDSDIDALSEPCGIFYSYVIKDDNKKNLQQEKTLVFVIDVIGNRFLRERYPEIEINEEKAIQSVTTFRKDEKGDSWLLCGNEEINCVINENIIIAIGSFDGVHINSIKILSGERILPKIDYVLEFFRRYS